MDSTRVDRWLWSVRLYKTRSAATAACRGNHIRINQEPAKAAALVQVGDTVTAYAGGRERIVEVVRVIDKRVGAPEAEGCVIDHSPPPPTREEAVWTREPSAGRPTKRDRRQLDRLRRH